jgi:hypothetical protein
MGTPAQAKAVKNYRKRLAKRGMVRFEVLGLKKDRDLVRAVASHLAENNAEAEQLRATVSEKIAPGPRKKGSLYEALRRWPIADLDLKRPFVKPRKIDL